MGPLVETVDSTFPGTLSVSIWTISLDKSVMKTWTPSQVRGSFNEFETQFAMRMPGAAEVSSGIYRMLARFNTRSFFSRVPLLLLQTLMVATVLFFLVMMVSYLVRSRQADSALLSARGVSTSQLFRIYALEGLIMTVIAVLFAPFLAVAGVALAGKLPFFREMTNGEFLPLVVGPMPFIVAAATGLACLVVYAIPAAVGTRGGLLLHKLRFFKTALHPVRSSILSRHWRPRPRRPHLLGTLQPGENTRRWSLQKRRGQRSSPPRACHLPSGRGAPLPQGLPCRASIHCGRISDAVARAARPRRCPTGCGHPIQGDTRRPPWHRVGRPGHHSGIGHRDLFLHDEVGPSSATASRVTSLRPSSSSGFCPKKPVRSAGVLSAPTVFAHLYRTGPGSVCVLQRGRPLHAGTRIYRPTLRISKSTTILVASPATGHDYRRRSTRYDCRRDAGAKPDRSGAVRRWGGHTHLSTRRCLPLPVSYRDAARTLRGPSRRANCLTRLPRDAVRPGPTVWRYSP